MTLLQVVIEAPPPPPPPPDPAFIADAPWMWMHGGQLFLLIALAIVAAAAVLWPLMRALGRRLEGGGGDVAGLQAELEALRRQQVADLDGGLARIAELEERVDFVERLLARQEEPIRIEGGRDAR